MIFSVQRLKSPWLFILFLSQNPLDHQQVDSLCYQKLTATLFELMSEITAPAFGQGLNPHGAPQRFQIVLLKRIQANNVFHSDAIAVTTEPLYRVSGLNLTFAQNRKIESAQTADEKPLDHISPPELDCEFGARQARFCDHDLRASDAKAVADIDLFLSQPFGRKVFTKHPIRQLPVWQFVSPKLVVLDRVSVNSFAQAAMHGQICLSVAIEVQSSQHD
jgi:hypothetical protein